MVVEAYSSDSFELPFLRQLECVIIKGILGPEHDSNYIMVFHHDVHIQLGVVPLY
jgi:hypothetical protein